MSVPELTIHLNGRFRLLRADKVPIEIPGAKSQALLALLSTEPQLTRTRAWLQDKLWSDRSPQQSANNLRQVLFKLRDALGPSASALVATRGAIGLDPARVNVVMDGDGEFLEGIDVRDQEFEAWLAWMRARSKACADMDTERADFGGAGGPTQGMALGAPKPSTKVFRPLRALTIEVANERDSPLGRFERRFSELLFRSLRDLLDVDLVEPGQVDDERGLVAINLHAYSERPDQIGMRVTIHEGLGLATCWADSAIGDGSQPAADMGWPFRRLCHRSCDALVDRLIRASPSNGMDADFMAGTAMRRMFSMLPGSNVEAAQLLQKAHAIRPRGLFLAWRAQLAIIDFVESGGQRREELAELADELCCRAMAEEGTNANVLAAVSHARLVFDNDLVAAVELSKLAVLANPSNPLAWSARANALLNANETKLAHQAATAAHNLSRETSFRYWTEFQLATTEVEMGQHEAAIAHSQRARALNARYRPALRYLVGLNAEVGDFEAARSSLARLQRVENGLTIDRFTRDESYPVSMMRKAGLIDPAKLSEL